jgi:hypothetical protein
MNQNLNLILFLIALLGFWTLSIVLYSVLQHFFTHGTPNFNNGPEGTPQNFALRKRGTKQ